MEGKYLWMDPISYTKVASPNGKYLHWVTDLKDELPLIIGASEMALLSPMTLIQLFEQTIKNYRTRLALRYKVNGNWVTWSYEDYYLDSKKFGSSLVALGIHSMSTINIIGFNSPQWVIGFVGATFASIIPVGVYPTNNPEACQYVADHSEAELILVQNEYQLKKYLSIHKNCPKIKAFVVYWPGKELETLRQGRSDIFTYDEFLQRHTPEHLKEVENRMKKIRPTQAITIIYTSGTTGPPKGVMLSHDNCVWTGRALVDSSRLLSDEERVVSYLPLSHIAALIGDIFGAIYSRAAVTFADEGALQGTLVNTLKETKPTCFFGVPRVFEKMEEKIRETGAKRTGILKSVADWAKRVGSQDTLNHITGKPTSYSFSLANRFIFSKVQEALGLEQCKIILVGAAPVSKSTLEYFISLGMVLMNIYGMSECSAPTATNSFKAFKMGSTGIAILGTEIVIKGSKGELLPPDVRGEICFRGRHKFMGYYKNEKATIETIDSEGYIHSGDEGFLDQEGFLFITGRFKELIITAGGENIPPVLIEDALKGRCKIISNAFLVGDGRKFLAILITFRTLPNPDGSFSNRLAQEVVDFAQSIGITAKTVEDLIKDPRISKYIQDNIDVVNKESTSRAQEIKRFKFLVNDFSVTTGELTPTMKTKRKVVAEKYAAVIEEIYSDPKL